MKRAITIAHCAATLALVVIVAMTSYISPLSPDREISEGVDQGFTYKDTDIYLVGTPDVVDSPDKNGIRVGIDSFRDGLRHLHLFHVDENGKRLCMVLLSEPLKSELIAYSDKDGDGLPETKIVKNKNQIKTYELSSADWTLVEEKSVEVTTK